MCASNPLQRSCSCFCAAARAMLCRCSGLSMKLIIWSIVRITRDAWLWSRRLTRSWLSSLAPLYSAGAETGQSAEALHCSVDDGDAYEQLLASMSSSSFDDMFFRIHSKYCINSGFLWKRLQKTKPANMEQTVLSLRANQSCKIPQDGVEASLAYVVVSLETRIPTCFKAINLFGCERRRQIVRLLRVWATHIPKLVLGVVECH